MRIVTQPFELTLEERADLQLPLIRQEYRRSSALGFLCTLGWVGFIALLERFVRYESLEGAWIFWTRQVLLTLALLTVILSILALFPAYLLREQAKIRGTKPHGDLSVIEIDDQLWRARAISGVEIMIPTNLIFRLPEDKPTVVVLGNAGLLSSIPRRAFATEDEWLSYREWVSLLPVSKNLSRPRQSAVSPSPLP